MVVLKTFIKKKIFFVFLSTIISNFSFASSGLNSVSMFSFLKKSFIYQMRLQNRSKPIDKVLKDPDLDPKIRQKLLMVKNAKVFAQKQGLNITKNYDNYIKWHNHYVVWAVTASPKFEMKAYEWKFPIMGNFPYLGFFDEEDAKNEADSLKKQNYDVYIRGVTAYSTLGCFRDPVISTMLYGGEGDLINLIIHESTHSTVYVKNNSSLSEKVATFVGNYGEVKYLTEKYGENSKEVKVALDSFQDDREFGVFMKTNIESLRKIFDQKIEESEKLKQKDIFISEFKNNKISEFIKVKCKTKNYAFLHKIDWNNAVFMSFDAYFTDLNEVETKFNELNKDVKSFLKFYSAMN